MELDMKTLVFLIAFLVAGGLVLLGCYAIAYQGATFTSMKTLSDFGVAGILVILGIAQYKIFETAEKA